MSVYLLHQLLDEAAARGPSRIAVRGPKDATTYEQLAARATSLAGALVAAGVRPGDPVALTLTKSADAFAAVYGILASGACYVPIDPFAPATRAAAILRGCDIRVWVTSPDKLASLVSVAAVEAPSLRLALLTEAAEHAPAIEAHAWDAAGSAPLPAQLTDTHLAYVLHTSGSTGVPKGVAISHRASLTFVEMATRFFAIGPDDRLVSHAPLHFDLSVFDIFCAAAAAGSIVYLPEFYAAFPKKMAQAIAEQRITVWNSVVSALTMMLDRGKPGTFDLSSLRLALFSGELMPTSALRRLMTALPHAELYNIYGQTEANSSMYYRVGTLPADAAWRLPIGRPFPNFNVFALDASGQPIEHPGLEGELYIRSGSVAAGYWRDPVQSREKFLSDPLLPESGGRVYRTGDLVSRDAEGNWTFVGRRDNMVKSRGYRIELGEIELALHACAGVDRAAVVAIADDVIGNRLVAFVSACDGARLAEETLSADLRQRLPKYMVPEVVEIHDSLPQTSTGKVDRKRLTRDYLRRP